MLSSILYWQVPQVLEDKNARTLQRCLEGNWEDEWSWKCICIWHLCKTFCCPFISLILDRSESLYMKISNWKYYGRGPRFHAINMQPPQDAPSVSKKEGTFPTIGTKIDWVSWIQDQRFSTHVDTKLGSANSQEVIWAMKKVFLQKQSELSFLQAKYCIFHVWQLDDTFCWIVACVSLSSL